MLACVCACDRCLKNAVAATSSNDVHHYRPRGRRTCFLQLLLEVDGRVCRFFEPRRHALDARLVALLVVFACMRPDPSSGAVRKRNNVECEFTPAGATAKWAVSFQERRR
jgi:hypothetical protein